MKRTSTSWHSLSADRRLSRIQRASWLTYNLLNNALPEVSVDPRLRRMKFRIGTDDLERFWDGISPQASPARRLCDLFWKSLPWGSILGALGPARIIEFGCGSGTYGSLLHESLGQSFESYLGVDIEPHEAWAAFPSPAFRFAVGSASDAARFLGNANFVFTQSALEHFEEDLLYFAQVSAFVEAADYPVLQVHLVPTASCITTFPWHGVREYTPRTLSSVTRLFGDDTRMFLFSLGGPRCNRVHRKFITWPRLRAGMDLRQSRPAEYLDELRAAIEADFADHSGTASFYALVLASGFSCDPFGLTRLDETAAGSSRDHHLKVTS